MWLDEASWLGFGEWSWASTMSARNTSISSPMKRPEKRIITGWSNGEVSYKKLPLLWQTLLAASGLGMGNTGPRF